MLSQGPKDVNRAAPVGEVEEVAEDLLVVNLVPQPLQDSGTTILLDDPSRLSIGQHVLLHVPIIAGQGRDVKPLENEVLSLP